MIDRNYFESVLPEQIRCMGRPCRLSVDLKSGAEYDVASIAATHESYIILDVHASGEEPKRSEEWQREHPEESPWIFDQVVVPYTEILATFLTPKGAGAESDTSIGFRLPNPPG